MKRIISILFFIVIGLIIALAMVPFLFKDEIIDKIEEYAEKNIDAKVNFGDIDFFVLQSFPNATIKFENIDISGNTPFENVNLFSADELRLEANLVALIKDRENISIKELHLDQPIINIIVNNNGKANYDIVAESKEDSSSSGIELNLEKYSIQSANISYLDKTTSTIAQLKDFSQSGKGNFESEIFTLSTQNDIGQINVSQDNIPYLNALPLSGVFDLEVDNKASKYTILKNNLKINSLELDSKGFVKMGDNSFEMDLAFSSKEGDVKNFLSLIPGIYADKLPKLKTSGSAGFNALIKGTYNDNSYPAIDINLKANNGSIQGADLPQSIEKLNFDLSVKANNKNWSDMEVNIPAFSMESGGMPLAGNLQIKDPINKPEVKGSFQGEADLGTVSKLMDTGDLTIDSGKINGSFEVDASYEDVTNENYSAVKFDGDATLKNFKGTYQGDKIAIDNSRIIASPKQISLENTSGKLGKSDFEINSKVQNPVAYATGAGPLKADVNFNSDYLDVRPYISGTSEEQTSDQAAAETDLFNDSKINYNINIKKLDYPDYDISNLSAQGNLSNDAFKITEGKAKVNNSDLSLQGNFTNLSGYLNNSEDLNSEISISGKEINLANFESEGTTEGEESGVIYLPTNIQSRITCKFDKIIYDDIELSNAAGIIDLKNGKASFNNLESDIFQGNVVMNGSYDSNTKDGVPLFDMAYDVKQIQWSQAFETFNTFKVLAPIGKFIEGTFNIDFAIDGALDNQMSPDLKSISSKGFIHTFDGFIKSFIPLEKIGNSLGIKELKSSKITDTKNWFAVEDGKVIVDPFDFDINGMNFNASGFHGFNQDVEYKLKAQIPRELLKKNQVSSIAEKGLKYLEDQSKQKGVNIDIGDYIYMDIFVTGSITNPKIKIIPTGSGGKNLNEIVKDEFTDLKEKAIETAKNEARERSNAIKDSLKNRANVVVDDTKDKVEEKKNEILDKGKEAVTEKVKDVIDDSAIADAKDTINSKISEEANKVLDGKVDDLKDKLGDLNPFKKKKGG